MIEKDLIRTYKLAKLGVETYISVKDIELMDYLMSLLSDLKEFAGLCNRTYNPLLRYKSSDDVIVFSLMSNFIGFSGSTEIGLMVNDIFFKNIDYTYQEIEPFIIKIVENLYFKRIDYLAFVEVN